MTGEGKGLFFPMPKKILLIALLCVCALIAGMLYFAKRGETREQNHQLVMYGNVDIRQASLGFRVSGRIRKLYVDEGDPVKTGQLLGELDPAVFEAACALAKGELAQAQARYDKLKNGYRAEEIAQAKALVEETTALLKDAASDHERNSDLIAKNIVSTKDFDASLSKRDQARARLDLTLARYEQMKNGYRAEEIEEARAAVESARALLDAREIDLKDAHLYAPSEGIVQIRVLEEGVIAGAGNTVFTLTLNDPVWVRAYVSEKELGLIHPGMEVELYTDSRKGVAAKGKIGFISPVAEFTPKTVETATLRTDLVYRLRVVVENPDGSLRQGMPVTLKIKLDR